MNILWLRAAALASLALGLLASPPASAPYAAQKTRKQDQKPKTSETIGKEFGSKPSAAWTATTNQSATTPEQKAWLGRGKPQTIAGEVVDISCYMQLGKTGEKHIDCGSKCLRNNQPFGILTAAKQLYVVVPEEHHPRRDGQVNIRDAFAAQMGKQVKVTGMVQNTPQGKAIFVNAAEVQKP